MTRSGPKTGRLGDEPTTSVSRTYASAAEGGIGHERESLNTHHTRICECAFFSCNLLPRSLFVQRVSAVSCVLGKGVNERKTERAVLFFLLLLLLSYSCFHFERELRAQCKYVQTQKTPQFFHTHAHILMRRSSFSFALRRRHRCIMCIIARDVLCN